MRSGRSLLILLGVAGALGAYIYFVEAPRDPAATEAKEKLFSVEAGAIEEINVTVPSGTTSLKKAGDAWSITAPVTAPADSSAISGMTNTLSSIEIERVLEENPASVTPYGLDAPSAVVTFKAAGSSATHKLEFGRKVPAGSSVYARIDGQPRLLVIPSYHEESLNRTAFDLRDKRALSFPRDGVETLALAARGKPPVALVQKNGDWSLTAPLAARADFEPIDTIIGRASGAQMAAVVSEGSEPTPAQLKTYGLDAPQLTLTIGAGSTRASLAIGGKRDASTLYARDLSRPVVFAVENALLTDLTKTADDLRVKSVFAFQSYNGRTIDITSSAATVSYVKARPAGASAEAAEVWSETKPKTRDINQTAITDLLNTLSSLRADRFVDRVPSGGADFVVAARYGEPDKLADERVTLRKIGDTVYAIREGDPGAAVVPTTDFDKAVTQLNTLTSAK